MLRKGDRIITEGRRGVIIANPRPGGTSYKILFDDNAKGTKYTVPRAWVRKEEECLQFSETNG